MRAVADVPMVSDCALTRSRSRKARSASCLFFAFAESQLGVDQTIHAPVTSSLDFDSGVSSTFDAAANTDNTPLASVELDQNSQTLGVR